MRQFCALVSAQENTLRQPMTMQFVQVAVRMLLDMGKLGCKIAAVLRCSILPQEKFAAVSQCCVYHLHTIWDVVCMPGEVSLKVSHARVKAIFQLLCKEKILSSPIQ